jgi:hypothetical protein
MAAKCSLCGSDDGIRSLCPKSRGRVVCRDCCLSSEELPGLECPWWDLCTATDLRQWRQ